MYLASTINYSHLNFYSPEQTRSITTRSWPVQLGTINLHNEKAAGGNYFHPRCCARPRQDSIKHMTDVLHQYMHSGRLTHLLWCKLKFVPSPGRNAPSRAPLPGHTDGRKIAQRPLLGVGLNKLTPFELEAINFISAAGCLWERVFQRHVANERIALTLTKL